MSKFIHKYYMEIVAILIVTAFWTGLWAYHSYQTANQSAFENAHTYTYTSGSYQ